MSRYQVKAINSREYDRAVKILRSFFQSKIFIEISAQSGLSLLTVGDNLGTMAVFNYAGETWPLPQTSQIWLEYELLNNPHEQGYYCVSASYRQEPNPQPERHDLIFPIFEFEGRGDMDELIKLEQELLDYVGFGSSSNYVVKEYEELAQRYNVKRLGSEEERRIWEDFGDVCFIINFPQYTNPFWNIQEEDNYAKEVDVILYGVKTISSAERSCDSQSMRELFRQINGGKYAEMLYAYFGKDRVEEELEKYLSHQFFARYGGGIGLTRFIRALRLNNAL